MQNYCGLKLAQGYNSLIFTSSDFSVLRPSTPLVSKIYFKRVFFDTHGTFNWILEKHTNFFVMISMVESQNYDSPKIMTLRFSIFGSTSKAHFSMLAELCWFKIRQNMS